MFDVRSTEKAVTTLVEASPVLVPSVLIISDSKNFQLNAQCAPGLTDPRPVVRIDSAKELAVCLEREFQHSGISSVVSVIDQLMTQRPLIPKEDLSETLVAGQLFCETQAVRNFRLSVVIAIQKIFQNDRSTLRPELAKSLLDAEFYKHLVVNPEDQGYQQEIIANNFRLPLSTTANSTAFQGLGHVLKYAAILGALQLSPTDNQFNDEQQSAKTRVYTTMVGIFNTGSAVLKTVKTLDIYPEKVKECQQHFSEIFGKFVC